MAKLRADIATLAKDLRSLGLAAAGTAQHAAETGGDRLRTDIDEAVSELRRRGEKTLQDARARVEEQPLFAILIALVIGFIGDWAGLALWTRQDLEQYPFLKVD